MGDFFVYIGPFKDNSPLSKDIKRHRQKDIGNLSMSQESDTVIHLIVAAVTS